MSRARREGRIGVMTDDDLERYFERIGLPPVGREVVRRSRRSDPIRPVQGGHGNRFGHFFSAKMNCFIQFEARRTEWSAVHWYEYDHETIEYYEQAVSARLPHGRLVFDMLVLGSADARLESWKTRADVEASIARGETRFVRGADGAVSWPQADEAARKLGLNHVLRLDTEIPGRFRANLEALAPYRRTEYRVNDGLRERVQARLLETPAMKHHDLVTAMATDLSPDDLNTLIAQGGVYTDLRTENVNDGTARLFASRAMAELEVGALPPRGGLVRLEAGARVVFDGKPLEVLTAGDRLVLFRGEAAVPMEMSVQDVARHVADGLLVACEPMPRPQQPLRASTDAALKEAQSRAEAIERAARGVAHGSSPRSIRRWKQKVRHGRAQGLPVRDALVVEPRGGRRQLSAHTEAAMLDAIENEFETTDAPSVTAIHRSLKAILPEAEVPALSTIHARIKARNAHKTELARFGKKAAYDLEHQYWYLDEDTPIHGERPFERVHIDHTQLDIEIIDRETGLNLGRPWLTVALDAYSRRVLGHWLSFQPPSRVAALAVNRRIAERFNRLPETVMVDGGREFDSEDFSLFCLDYEVSIMRRVGDPRAGSLLERFFGMNNTMFIHYLAGSTQVRVNVRRVSQNVDPSKLAVWDLGSFEPALKRFFELYDQRPHPALGISPLDAFNERLSLVGDRPHRFVRVDEAFRIRTLPSTPKGTARVGLDGSITVNTIRYVSRTLKQPGVPESNLPVVFDPLDARHCYVAVRGDWVECIAPRLKQLGPMTIREAEALATELQMRPTKFAASRAESEVELGRFLRDIRETEDGNRRYLRGRAERALEVPSETIPSTPGVGETPELARVWTHAEQATTATVDDFSVATAETSPTPSPSDVPIPATAQPAIGAITAREAALLRPVETLADF